MVAKGDDTVETIIGGKEGWVRDRVRVRVRVKQA